MVLGIKELLKLVKESNLVENLSERELTNPEGAGFDLRLGELYKLQGGKAFLGEFERETPGLKYLPLIILLCHWPLKTVEYLPYLSGPALKMLSQGPLA